MKKRLLSMLLALSMVIGMLPMTALAAADGDKATTATNVQPEAVSGFVWVSDNEDPEEAELICEHAEEADHVHDDECYEMICGHEEEGAHNPDCYESGEWKVCEKWLHYILGEHSYFLATLFDGCYKGETLVDYNRWTNGRVNWVKNAIVECEKVGGADWEKLGYIYVGETLNCQHKEHTDECYALSCEKHIHEKACYGYKWILKTDANGDGIPDEEQTQCEIQGHSFTNYVSNKDAACEKDGTKTAKCDRCDATDTIEDKDSALGHSFTNYVSNKDATCTADGTKTAKCDRCDATDTIEDKDSALGHSFTNYVSNKDATCTADGTKTAKCDRCDATDTVADEGSALDHSFTKYVSNNDATCTADGTKTATCDRCDATDTVADEGSALDHSFTNYVSDGNATCTADGTKTAKCDRCDATDTQPDVDSKLGHSFTNYVNNGDSTCLGNGSKTAKCDRCTETDTITAEGSALGHSFTNYVSNNDATCTADGTKTAKCDRCDVTDTVADEGSALGHSFTKYVSNNDATCLENGTETAKCDRCDVTDTRTDDESALGHSFTEYVSNNDATCLENGTETAKCDRCDVTDTRTDDESALGHSFTNYVSNKDATCTADGTKTAKCDRCDVTDTVADEDSALGHDWGDWAVTKKPSASEKGEAKRVCGRDATHVETKVLPKLPVDENGNFTGGEGYAFEVIDEPTCTKDGRGEYTYTEMDETGAVTFKISFEVVIPATGHDYVITVVKADCLNDGYTKYDCSKCNEEDFIAKHVHTDECYTCDGTSTVAHEHGPECYIKDLSHNILRDGWFTCPGEKICLYCKFDMPVFTGAEMIDAYFPKLDRIPDWMSRKLKYHPVRPVAFFCEGEGEHEHTDACELNCEWLAKGHLEETIPAVAPTCTETGLTEGIICVRENCPKGGILKPQEKVDKLGHEKGEYKVASETPATCTEWGSIIRRALCTRCEIQLDETVELLKPTGHDYEAVVTDPTCTEGGYTTYTCKNDATHTYIANETAALGHKPGDPIEVATKNPTCTEPGYVDYNIQCVVCEEVLRNGRRDIPATGHDYEAVVTDPTCTEGGYTTYTCKNDATHTYIAGETAALGHDMGDWVVTKQPTYSAKGEERRDCNRCDYFETREIDQKRAPITPVGPAKPEVTTKYLNTKDHVAYIIGYADGTVRPRGEITRAEIATIYFRLMTDENRENFWSTENEFVDVNENNWFNLAVSTLNNAGVIVDVEDGKFRPNDPITRAELAVMAAQFCEVEGKLPKTAFTDVDKDHWAYDEIALIEFAGWIEGYPDGSFRPDNTITRAEAMTIINRMLERAVEEEDMLEGMVTFADCAAAEWFYEAVQEATNSHDYKRSKDEVEDRGYKYEIWTELLEAPNWAAMEQAWINAR